MNERFSHVVAVDCRPSTHVPSGAMQSHARVVNLGNARVNGHDDEADLLALSEACDRRTAQHVAEQLNGAPARSDSRIELCAFVRRQLRDAMQDSTDGW